MTDQADSTASYGDMAQRLASDTFLVRAVQAAVQAAVGEHRRAGNPVAGWQDGRVVLVAPEDIPTASDVAPEVAAV